MTLLPRCWICNVVLTTANAASVSADGSRALCERWRNPCRRVRAQRECKARSVVAAYGGANNSTQRRIPRRGPAWQCRARREVRLSRFIAQRSTPKSAGRIPDEEEYLH
jgi:hypothetical protein